MEMLGKVRRMHYRDGLSPFGDFHAAHGLVAQHGQEVVEGPGGASPAYRRNPRRASWGRTRAALIQALKRMRGAQAGPSQRQGTAG